MKRNLKKCEQSKCFFLISGGCRACQDCKAEPFMLDDNCDVCWNCSHDEGILRWNMNEEQEKDTIKENEEKEKPMEIIVQREGRWA